MAVYRIFSEKDAFIWNEQPTQNTGRDEILQISTYNDPDLVNGGNLNSIPSATRALVKFKQSDIDTVIDRIVSHSAVAANQWSVRLGLYLANASNLPQDYTLTINAISQSWEMGTGRFADRPRTTNGVSWTYRYNSASFVAWQTSSFQANVTSSDNGIQRGGGNYFINPSASVTFNYTSDKDLSVVVRPIVELWHSHSVHGGPPEAFGNEGFIIKYTGSQEFNTASIQQLSFFSMDTHTIYPPYLEFRWPDDTYNTGSSPTITNSNFITTIGNLQPELQAQSVYRFQIYTRDQYPPRTFQTQSAYLNTKLLPPEVSYWELKDANTGEVIVPFGPWTKLSATSEYNYFEFFANGFEPERYYQIIIRTTVDDQTIIIENPNYYFKIVR